MRRPWGIYVHAPFCRYKCIYCDFDSGVYSERLIPEYVSALLREIKNTKERLYPDGFTADTVYFGGGTPSLLTGEQIQAVLAEVRFCFTMLDDSEITLEANPGTLTLEKAKQFMAAGVNRVSLGAQTFHNHELKMLGRIHTAEHVGESLDVLRAAGFKNINLDLIAGLPAQTMEGWTYNLDCIFSLQPTHISMYLLEVHEETKLADLIARGTLPEPDDELSVAMYYALVERAEAEGYLHYEISNFSLPGFQSRHNLKYWSDVPYVGFGCSAHSYDFRERRSNVLTPTAYLSAMQLRGDPVEERVMVTDETRRQEALFLGLRRTSGVDLNAFKSQYGVDVVGEYGSKLAPLIEAGLVEADQGRLRLTRKGLVLANEVFAVFV